jgi:hypothetical protein
MPQTAGFCPGPLAGMIQWRSRCAKPPAIRCCTFIAREHRGAANRHIEAGHMFEAGHMCRRAYESEGDEQAIREAAISRLLMGGISHLLSGGSTDNCVVDQTTFAQTTPRINYKVQVSRASASARAWFPDRTGRKLTMCQEVHLSPCVPGLIAVDPRTVYDGQARQTVRSS